MTTYEDVQRELHNDLMGYAATARKWQNLKQDDESEHAWDIARAASKRFSDFLVTDYIPHGCYDLRKAVSWDFPDKLRAHVEAIGVILDDNVGPSAANIGMRRDIMEFSNKNVIFSDDSRDYDRETKNLNGRWRVHYPAAATNTFTNDVVRSLFVRTGVLKTALQNYVREGASSVAVKSEFDNHSLDRSVGSVNSVSANPTLPEVKGNASPRYHPALGRLPANTSIASGVSSPTDAPSPPGRKLSEDRGPSPDYGPPPSSVNGSSAPDLLASAQPPKRRAEEGLKEPSNKRPRTDDRGDRSSHGAGL